MRKKFYLFVFILTCVFSFSACSDDDYDEYAPFTPSESSGAYVMNQGNYYTNIAGSIGYLDYGTEALTDSIFVRQNGVTPGNTLQCGLIYGTHLFAIAYQSNVLFVTNKDDVKLQKTLQVNAPRALAAANGYVFISNYNGYVTRVDAHTLTVKDSVKVGPNPEEMAMANGYLYVTNSDGLNYNAGYANGKSVSKINLSTFKVEKTISVGMNPQKVAADSKGNVFIIAMGDYGSTPAKIQKINAEDKVSDVAEASIMTVRDTLLYAVNSVTDWTTSETVNTYFKYNTVTGEITNNLFAAGVKHPISINVDPVSKNIFLTSFNDGQWGADYSGAGYVNEYTSAGLLLKTYATGVNPVQMVFNVK